LAQVIACGGSNINSLDKQVFFEYSLLQITGLQRVLPSTVTEWTLSEKGLVVEQREKILAAGAAFNAKLPGRDYRFMNTPCEVLSHACKFLKPGESRAYVTTQTIGNHSLVMDVRKHAEMPNFPAGRITCVILDALSLAPTPEQSVDTQALGLKGDFSQHMQGMDELVQTFLFCYTGCMRDFASCLGKSLDLLKSLERNPDYYRRLHEQALLGEAPAEKTVESGKYLFMDTDTAIRNLPIDVFVNLHSSEMAAKIVTLRPEALCLPLKPHANNPARREETFLQRLKRITRFDWAIPTDEEGVFAKNPDLPLAAKTLPLMLQYWRYFRNGADFLRKASEPSVNQAR
jgi:hypothetical protein